MSPSLSPSTLPSAARPPPTTTNPTRQPRATTHNPNHSRNKTKMKFQSSILSVLALTAAHTSAFAPIASRASVSTCLNSIVYPLETKGETGTESFRLGFQDPESKAAISPWHDIPLEGKTEGSYNMVVEIPKMTKAKMEVATKEENNPIAQDIKKGVLRDYHGPIFWNYGTWRLCLFAL